MIDKSLALALISVLVLAAPFSVIAEPVKQAAQNGMILNLGKHTQQIKVRAKALGPADCNVEFTIQGKAVAVVAPVGEYSDWVGVGPTYYGPANEKLGVSVKCDAGAITQVKYYQ